MPVEPKRSVLSDLRKPLIQPTGAIPIGLEEKLLGLSTEIPAKPVHKPETASAEPEGRVAKRATKARVPTVPVTFHLPVDLRDRVKLTAQAKQKTMLEVAIEALTEYLGKYPVSEDDVRRLLGI